MDGLYIGIIADKKEIYLLDRVGDALKLIKQHDPLRYSRILRDIKRIWISVRLSGGGEFNLISGICHLDKRYVKSSSTQAIASMIVHEAAHGYPCLRKMGYPETLRHRIELICIRQELIFAQRLPDNESLCETLERKLKRDPSFWSNREFTNRRPGQELAALRATGVPEWSIKLALKLRELRWKFFHKRP
ncbi:MAG: hypothetical protein KGL20_00735 [Rhodospirillales bacterium]|nr:hypothetical protein [Rhodospirillales bacterium]